MKNWRTNPWRTALITGASSGIGAAYARMLAAQGLDLILVARSRYKLNVLARALARQHGCRIEVLETDLTRPNPGPSLFRQTRTRKLEVDLLINSAGFGTVGPFHQQDAAREQQQIFLNAAALVDLTRAFLPGMVERGTGGIVNVASLAAMHPLPYMTVYAATKAFVLSFSEGLRAEYQDQGIEVLCVCPGPVDTPFFRSTGSQKLRATVRRGTMLKPERVVLESLRALEAGRGVCIPGYTAKAAALSTRILPRTLINAFALRVLKP